MNNVIAWLLESEPWVEYRTRLDLLGEMENDQSVINAKNRIIVHPKVKAIFSDLYNWNEQVVKNHKNAELPLHKLSFIADIGLSINDPEVKKITDIVMEHQDNKGVLQVIMNILKHFGGTGENNWARLCGMTLLV